MSRKPGRTVAVLVFLSSWALVVLTGCAARRAPRAMMGDRAAGGAEAAEAEQGPGRWFMAQRLSGDDPPPVAVRARALAAARAGGHLTLAPGTWVSAGPYNIGGRVTALGVDPANSAHLWLGTAEGGVFSSFDSGTNWTPVFDGHTALSIGSLAVHPSDPQIVYVGTGEDNGGGFSYDGEGVFKTTDGGASWTSLGLAEVRRIGRIAVDPSNADRIFVAAGGGWFSKDVHRGIYRSLDGGASWEKTLFVADDAGAIDVAIDPASPNRIFAAIWQRYSAGTSWYIGGSSSGIYRSLDGGTTWTQLTSGLPSAGVGRIGLAIAPSSPQTVYACVINDQGRLDGIYRSTNSGDTWTKVSGATVPNQFSSYSYYFGQIRVSPTNPNTVYALELNLLRSTNGGVSFTAIATSVHVDWHALIVETSGRWLAGTDGGFFRSVNGGSTWVKATTLPITQFYDLGIDRLNPARRFAGAQDNNTVRTTTGGLSDWTAVIGGDGLQCEVDYSDSNKVYGEYQYGHIRRSTDGGETFVDAAPCLDFCDRTNWNAPITLDPAVPSTLYTGTYRLYRSSDSALSWEPISGDLSNGHPLTSAAPLQPSRAEVDVFTHPAGAGDGGGGRGGGDGAGAGGGEGDEALAISAGETHLRNLVDATITVVSVSPVDNRILWIGTDDGNVWVSTDQGASYDQVNPLGPGYWVTDIEPDRFEANTAYLTVSGYRTGDALPYVRITRNLGQSWQDVGAGLPQVPVSAVLPSSEWRGRLFAGNDLGVFLSDDDGESWSEMRAGMPYVVVMDLVEQAPSHTLFAATHGRSIYTYDLGQLPAPDGDGDGVDNNADCARGDAGAFALPDEVVPLNASKGPAGDALLSWPSLAAQAGSATRYDVASGTLASLRPAGTAASGPLACALAGTSLADAALPAAGDGLYYIVRARNVCGTGSWGRDSAGVERTSPACP